MATVEQALAVAAEGRPVFPCDPTPIVKNGESTQDKSPLTTQGFKDATTDETQIREWWARHPGALIGVPTGTASGLYVIDCEGEGNEWVRHNWNNLEPRRVHTTRRGMHLLYVGATELPGSAKKYHTGVDTRGAGGYIIWWPAEGLEARGDQPGPLPQWWREFIGNHHAAPKPFSTDGAKVGEGGRNDFLSREAYRLRKTGASVESILAILATINEERCDPPVDEGELRVIAGGKAKVAPDPTATEAFGGNIDPELAALHPAVRAELSAAPADVMFLPNDHLEPNVAARRIFEYLGNTREMYRRGDAVVELNSDKRLIPVSSTMFRSRLNKGGRRVRSFKWDANGDKLIHAPKLCSEDGAKLLLASSAIAHLPEIKLVTRMPVLVERDGALITTQAGYNTECGVFVVADVAIPLVPLADAAVALRDLLRDFQFAAPGDSARALAGFVAPGLRMGRLLYGDALITSMEADDSQAGKGFKLKLDRAIYGEPAYPVTQKEGGVGSLDESLAQALLSGAPFVNFDNLRGSVRSAYLESIITAGTDRVSVRVPHRGEVQVDIGRTSFQLTSNGFNSTVDLANRLLMVRLRKQPAEYAFTQYPEGGLIQRVEKYAAYYLGCVHAVIRHWHAAGKPRLDTKHTFKEWVGSLDWIVQSVWQTVPLLDGHAAATERVASPSLSWLRQVGFVVLRESKGGHELRAGDLREVCERAGLLPEGVKPGWEENAVERAIGRTLGSCFTKGDVIELDTLRVERRERDVKRDNYGRLPTKFYVFQPHGSLTHNPH